MNTSRKFETLPAELQVRSRTSRTVDLLCIDLGASFTIVFCVNRTLWKWAVHTAQVYIAVLQKTCPVPTSGLFFFLRLFNHFRWRKQWQHTPVLLPEKSHGRRSLVGCSPRGLKESDRTEWLHFHFHALEKEMATHSSVLAWRIPGMAESGGLPSMGSHRVGHDWHDLAATAAEI